MIEDGENMVQQQQDARLAQETKREYERCAVCSKDLWSINTRHVAGKFMDYTCADPINKTLDAVNQHIVEGIIALVKDGFTVKEACIRAGTRHLDVKTLSDLERLL